MWFVGSKNYDQCGVLYVYEHAIGSIQKAHNCVSYYCKKRIFVYFVLQKAQYCVLLLPNTQNHVPLRFKLVSISLSLTKE